MKITHDEAKISVLTVEGLLRNCFDDTIELTTLKNYIKHQEKVEDLLKAYQFWFSQEDKSDHINVLEACI